MRRIVSHALPSLAAALALAAGALAAPKVGTKAPEVVVRDLNGNAIHLAQLRGHSPVLLNFFSIT